MPFTNAYLFWEEDYLQREKEFIDFIKYVPPSEKQKSVWSLKLANQLILIGSSIDSFFKQAMPYYLNKNIQKKFISRWGDLKIIHDELVLFDRLKISNVKMNVKCKKGYSCRKLNMADFSKLFGDYYNLISKHVVYIPITKEEIVPFEEWENNGNLKWWDAYTSIKHNRFKNREYATIEIVLNALAALFLLNVYYPPNRKFLAEQGVIYSQYNQGLNNLIKILEKEVVETTSAFMPIAKTKLFAYMFDDNQYWRKYDDPWKILDPFELYDK